MRVMSKAGLMIHCKTTQMDEKLTESPVGMRNRACRTFIELDVLPSSVRVPPPSVRVRDVEWKCVARVQECPLLPDWRHKRNFILKSFLPSFFLFSSLSLFLLLEDHKLW